HVIVPLAKHRQNDADGKVEIEDFLKFHLRQKINHPDGYARFPDKDRMPADHVHRARRPARTAVRKHRPAAGAKTRFRAAEYGTSVKWRRLARHGKHV